MKEELIGLRDRLRALGYDAALVNGDCFDVEQGGYTHYLSRAEAESLNRSGLDLMAHSERRGLNRWYDFTEARGSHDELATFTQI